jgi:hypothetical protein
MDGGGWVVDPARFEYLELGSKLRGSEEEPWTRCATSLSYNLSETVRRDACRTRGRNGYHTIINAPASRQSTGRPSDNISSTYVSEVLPER